jgi:hypothetical protein
LILKRVPAGLVTVLMLAWSGASLAADYRPDEFLGLDLSKAVLSPKRLGPSTEFAPVPVEARSDRDTARRAALGETPRKIATERVRGAEPMAARAKSAPPRGAARTRLAHRREDRAHRRGNPLDAQAMDTRIQTWPCKSGGICNWKH